MVSTEVDKFKSFFGFYPSNIIHVGANMGAEIPRYTMAGSSAILIEPLDSCYDALLSSCSALPQHKVIKALVADTAGKPILFNVACSDGQSSSMLPLSGHKDVHPEISFIGTEEHISTTLDVLATENQDFSKCQLLVMDVQGAENLVIAGAKNFLANSELLAISVEVSHDEQYLGGSTFISTVSALDEHGFALSQAFFNDLGYTDAFFVRKWWEPHNLTVSGFNKSRYVSLKSIPFNISELISSSIYAGDTGRHAAAALKNGDLDFAFHTKADGIPSVTISLEAPIEIKSVLRLFNRKYSCWSRASSIQASVSSDLVNWHKPVQSDLLAGFLKGKAPLELEFAEPFRHIRISLSEKEYLHLSKIEIFSMDQ